MLTEKSGYMAQCGLGLNLLSQEQRETIHHAACRLLRTTGLTIEHEGAADRLSSAGAKVFRLNLLSHSGM